MRYELLKSYFFKSTCRVSTAWGLLYWSIFQWETLRRNVKLTNVAFDENHRIIPTNSRYVEALAKTELQKHRRL